MTLQQINQIFKIFNKDNSNPKSELRYTNEFTLLVAIILSAQATDISVNKATVSLFSIADTPEKMLNLGKQNLQSYIKTIGLHNSKANNIIDLSKQLVNVYHKKIPDDFNKLIKLPGIGRKTANVFLNSAYGKAVIGVDTHVFRVARRLGITTGNTLLEVEEELTQKIPNKWLSRTHNWLVLHGRYICKSRKPLCEVCKLKKFCHYYLTKN